MLDTILIVNTRIDKDKKTNQHLQKTLKHLSPNADIITVHYEKMNAALIEKIKPNKMILSGQSTPFNYYPREKLNVFFGNIKKIECPILGICGGHQLLALCYGGTVAPMNVFNPTLENYDGCWREKGFVQVVKQTVNDLVLKDIQTKMMVFEDHCDEVKQVPNVFRVLCKGKKCKIQGMKHWRKPIYGVQFHPERYNENHIEGKQILKNFLNII